MGRQAFRSRGSRYGARLLGVAMILLYGCAVNPVTGRQQFSLMSEAQELRIGEEAYPLYTQMSEGLFQEPELQAYVQAVGERLGRVSHRPDLPYEFNVVNSSEINAYALPGGKVSITRGLLNRMTNEAQLAGVLGHEVGHVTARHGAAGYTRQVLAGLVTAAGVTVLQTANVGGGDLIAQGGMLATSLVLSKYSRDQERESDALGFQYMTQAGYNPEGLVQTMEILMSAHDREPSAVETLFSSHPLSSERVATVQNLAATAPASLRTREALGEEPFRRATERLRAVAPAYAKMDEGRKALAAKNNQEALALLGEAARLAPDQALIWVHKAAAEARAEKTEDAYASAQRAATLYPDLYQARYVAGALAFELKKHPESLGHLDAADRLVPDQPQVTFYRGRNFEAQGRRDDAARAYAAVLQKVQQGPVAEYCYNRLVEWGYVRPPAAPARG
ncbi:MAG: M48 family metalloprotease [Deferrisomatales bacterium]|nr:M48 family metalloprotease [Deferrisomatales bacterium]